MSKKIWVGIHACPPGKIRTTVLRDLLPAANSPINPTQGGAASIVAKITSVCYSVSASKTAGRV